jgi:cold shock CspA family protein
MLALMLFALAHQTMGFSISSLRFGSATRALSISHQPLITLQEEGVTKTGTCKWFNIEKGYGFIAVDGEGSDIFVHQTDIYAPGFRSLAEGEQVEFRVAADAKTGKLKATDVTGPDGAYVQGAPRQVRDDDYY